MTEKLKSLLHEQAETVDFAVPDVAALTRAGDRRVRRRRGLVGGVAALAVVGALAAPRIVGGAPDSTPVVSEPVPQPAEVTWATGYVLHVGDRTIDVGVAVKAFVRTERRFRLGRPRRRSSTRWSTGRSATSGRTDARHPRLVADSAGTLVGWVERDGDRLGFVVLDQATGRTTRNDDATAPGMGLLADQPDPAYFYAISDGTAYWRDLRGAVAVDLASGDVRVIDADARNGFDILDAEDGVIAFNASDDGTALGATRRGAVMLPQVYGEHGHVLSRCGLLQQRRRRAAGVRRTHRRAGRARPATTRSPPATSGWTAHRLAVLAQETGRSPVQLLTCAVPAGTCDVTVADLGSFDDLIRATGSSCPVGEDLYGE